MHVDDDAISKEARSSRQRGTCCGATLDSTRRPYSSSWYYTTIVCSAFQPIRSSSSIRTPQTTLLTRKEQRIGVSTMRRQVRRGEDPDGSPPPAASPPVPFLPFLGVPSLDNDQQRTTITDASSEKDEASSSSAPTETTTKQQQLLLPFGLRVETIAVAEQLLMDSVAPVQETLDALTGDWALSYADLSPDTPRTVTGQAFLATNAAYFVAGVYILLVSGDLWFGFWTDMAAIASFNYHYNQLLVAGTAAKADAVRLALLLDYTAAAFSILTAGSYLLSDIGSSSSSSFPVVAVAVSAVGLVCLYLSWVWEYGRPYMFWHSLWHLCSAYSGYLIGTLHASSSSSVQQF